jgi:hypothetical protein
MLVSPLANRKFPPAAITCRPSQHNAAGSCDPGIIFVGQAFKFSGTGKSSGTIAESELRPARRPPLDAAIA